MPPIARAVPKPKVLSWTLHAQAKMGFYRLSPARVRRVLQTPTRVEEGVAPKTVAMMQPASLKKSTKGREAWTQEIWVMVEDAKDQRIIISAWRYPGISKPGEEIPVPQDIKNFLESGTID